MFRYLLILTALGLAGCFGHDETYKGRIVEKVREDSQCDIQYNSLHKTGTVTCKEERWALKLDNNDKWGNKTCFVSQRVYQESEVGQIFVCVFGEK